jgi:hypothetical protein
MHGHLGAKISQYPCHPQISLKSLTPTEPPHLPSNYEKNHGNVGNVKSFRSFGGQTESLPTEGQS